MIEVNWNNFKAKFNGKEQKTFEWLSYLLFCREFNQPNGIFRYFNQSGIETDPVFVNNEWISFQAKFFDTTVSKSQIIESIGKAKSKNPKLNKIYIYLNRTFSESSKKGKKKPQLQIDVENYGKTNGIKIDWRVESHFEQQLSNDKNLVQLFFTLEQSFIDFLTELKNHTNSILKPIRSEIKLAIIYLTQ